MQKMDLVGMEKELVVLQGLFNSELKEILRAALLARLPAEERGVAVAERTHAVSVELRLEGMMPKDICRNLATIEGELVAQIHELVAQVQLTVSPLVFACCALTLSSPFRHAPCK